MKISINKLILKYPISIWLTGLLLPILYLAYFISFKKVLNLLHKKNTLFTFLIVLLVIQLISLSQSFLYEYFTYERFFAHLHNITAFCFVFFGYALISDEAYREIIKKYTKRVFFILSTLIILSTLFYFLTQRKDLIFYGFPGLFNVNTKFNMVGFYFQEWYLNMNFPRTIVFSVYPNATGISLFLLHYIYISTNAGEISNREKLISTIFLIVSVGITGSRLFLLLSLSIPFILFIKNKTRLTLTLALTPFVMFAMYFLIEFLISQRESSNNARWMIYGGSLEYMLNTNPIFGLGMKPKLPEIINGPYPLGSHSTLLGYFVKCGLVGGFVALSGYLVAFVKYGVYLFNLSFSGGNFNKLRFIQITYFIIILLTSMLEDFDAIEIIPFYFGMCLYIIRKRI